MQQLTAEVRMNSADIQTMSGKLDIKADVSRVSALEQRVEALEA